MKEQINDLVSGLCTSESSPESLGTASHLISGYYLLYDKPLISDSFFLTYFWTLVSESKCELDHYVVRWSVVITINIDGVSSTRKLERHTVDLVKSNVFSRVVSTLKYSNATMEF